MTDEVASTTARERAVIDAVRYAMACGCLFPVPEPPPGSATETLVRWGALRHLHDTVAALPPVAEPDAASLARFKHHRDVVMTVTKMLFEYGATVEMQREVPPDVRQRDRYVTGDFTVTVRSAGAQRARETRER